MVHTPLTPTNTQWETTAWTVLFVIMPSSDILYTLVSYLYRQ